MVTERVVSAESIITITSREVRATVSRAKVTGSKEKVTVDREEATDNKVTATGSKVEATEVTTMALALRAGMVAEMMDMAEVKEALIKVGMQDHSKADTEAMREVTKERIDHTAKKGMDKTRADMEATMEVMEGRTDHTVKRDMDKTKADMDPIQELHTAEEGVTEVAMMTILAHCITLNSMPETAAMETCSTRP